MTAVTEDLRRVARFAYERSDHQKLRKACRAILEANPQDADARRLLGLAALRDSRPDLAEAWFRETTARRPDSATAWRDLACSLIELRRESEAEAILSAATARGVRSPGSLTMLGVIRARLDRDEDARSAFEAAIEVDPTRGEAYWGLADVGGLAPDDPAYAQAERLLRTDRFSPTAAVAAQFALAEANRRAGLADSFFKHVHRANAAQRATASGRGSERTDDWRRAVQEATVAARSRRRKKGGAEDNAGPTPIFVIGEPCCGAELAEAVLAEEPGAFAAGEVRLLQGAVARELARVTRRRGLDGVTRLNDAQRALVRAAYIERAQRIAPDARWFIDRSPDLALHVGALRFLFPEARIVRLERAPIQQGLDIYRRYWPSNGARRADLRTIGRDMRAARRASAQLVRVGDLDIAVVDAEELLASPAAAEPTLRDAAGLPMSLSTFSSRSVRRTTSKLVRFEPDFLKGHGRDIAPLRRGLGEFARA